MRLILSFLAGGLLVGAFAPFEWSPLAFVSLAAFFYICRSLSAGRAFFVGLAFGYGLFGIGVSWVYVSLHIYGGMPFWMGSLAVLAFAGVLALFPALTAYSAARLFPQESQYRILAMAFLWVLFEWLKSWIFTGFAWLEVGVSQTSSWFLGFAPIGGVYLVSFAVAICSSCIVWLFCYPKKLFPFTLLAFFTILSVIVNPLQWSESIGKPLKIGIVQGNVPIDKKWQPQYRDGVIAKLRSISQTIISQQSEESGTLDLLIWPETGLPLSIQQTDQQFWRDIVPDNTVLLSGILDFPNSQENYNAAVLNCDSQQKLYRKRHLVPFGEYLPMRFLFNWILDYLHLPMADFTPWPHSQSLSCENGIKIGLSICYEDAFASEMRQTSGDATLLVNISEDAWFGDSFAPHQRLQMGQMRAKELSRPMARSANSGPSAVIDHHGRVLARTSQFVEAALVEVVQPQTGDTPYKKFGNWIVWTCMLLTILLLFFYRRSPDYSARFIR